MPISPDVLSINILIGGTYVGFDKNRNYSAIPVIPKKTLIVGQMDPDGLATPGVPFLAPSKEYLAAQTGFGSLITSAASFYFEVDPFTETWLLPLNDAGGATAAEADITVTGPATGSGTIHLYVMGVHYVPVPVTKSDTANTIAAAINAAINAASTQILGFPITSEVATNVVTVTANWAGLTGNEITLLTNLYAGQQLPAGVALDIDLMTGGATDPNLTTPWGTLAADQYTDIVLPYTQSANLNVVEADLDEKFGITVAKDGMVYIGKVASLADMKTFGDSRNSPFVTAMPAGYSPSPGWAWAADVAGSWTRGSDPGDSITGSVLQHVVAPRPEDRLSLPEMNGLLRDNGFSSYKIGQDGKVRVDLLRTMYQVDGNNFVDRSYWRHATMKLLQAIRYTIVYTFTPYNGWKLAPDSAKVSSNVKVMKPKLAKAILIDTLYAMQSKGWIGNVDELKSQINVYIDPQLSSRLVIDLPTDLIQHADQFQFLVAHKG